MRVLAARRRHRIGEKLEFYVHIALLAGPLRLDGDLDVVGHVQTGIIQKRALGLCIEPATLFGSVDRDGKHATVGLGHGKVVVDLHVFIVNLGRSMPVTRRIDARRLIEVASEVHKEHGLRARGSDILIAHDILCAPVHCAADRLERVKRAIDVLSDVEDESPIRRCVHDVDTNGPGPAGGSGSPVFTDYSVSVRTWSAKKPARIHRVVVNHGAKGLIRASDERRKRQDQGENRKRGPHRSPTYARARLLPWALSPASKTNQRGMLSTIGLLFVAVCLSCSGTVGKTAEVPLASRAFIDSVGVNLHMTYRGTPYDVDFSKWAPMLKASGITHVREGVCSSNVSWCRNVYVPRLNELAVAGISAELSTSLEDRAQYDASYVRTMGLKNVDAFEGPNECDSGVFCPTDWKSVEGAWQKTLYALRTPAIAIIGPSMISQSGYSSLGNLSVFMDVGNIHDYTGQEPPEALNGGPTEHLEWAGAMSGGKPVWVTEMGYATNSSGVPASVAAHYITRALFEDLRVGVMRTYIYQLFDYGTDGGATMGLLTADYTPKPAWTQLKQLLAFFKDAGSSPRTPLTYQIQKDSRGTLHHVLFQRSDGTYVLVMWLAGSLYDTKHQSTLGIKSEMVRVVLPSTVTSAIQTHFMDDGTTQSSSPIPPSNGTVSVTVTSVVSALTFKT